MVIKSSCLRKLIPILLLPAASILPVNAEGTAATDSTDEVSVSADYYKSFTFEWTDSEGKSHVSDLTEPATEFNHIVALIKEVYLNPAIPGYTHDISAEMLGDQERIDIAEVPYLPCTYAPYNMPEDLQVERPIPGATALLVEMKDSYGADGNGINDPIEAIKAIKSVTLIPKQLYVGTADRADNPGYLFNVETTLNKFFIITKGSIRRIKSGHGFPPFYDMFEEFSPSNEKPIVNAFADMDAGKQFPVDHNCSTVIGQRHDIVMSDFDNPSEHSVNLMFFLPDLRFYGETRYKDGSTTPYEHHTFYVKGYQPFFFFNKINAEINGPVELDNEPSVAYVPVSWVSTYKDITRSQVPERFLVYRVVNDVVESEPVPASEIIVRQPDTELLEDGSLVRSADNLVEIYVKEPQGDTTRQVRYVILGRRHHSEFSFVESNVVDASIPGISEFETLNIIIDGDPRSTYDLHSQLNRYDHTINLTDTPGAGGHRLLNGHISVRKEGTAGTIFELRRYTSEDAEDFQVIATMEITAQEPDKTWTGANGKEGVHVYNGTISYPAGVNTDGLPLTCRFKSRIDFTDQGNDRLQPITAVDGMNGVIARFVDRFEVSTAKGDHPRNYHYRIAYQAAEDIVTGNAGRTAVSNAVSVAIPVRNLAAGYIPYTYEQVMADEDAYHRLATNPVGIAVTSAKNPAIVGYDITNVTQGKVVAKALRSPSGIFQRFVLTPDGDWDSNTNPATAPAFSGKLPFVLTDMSEVNDEFALTIVYDNGNTYGNPYCRLTPLPVPEITSMSLECSGGRPGPVFQYSGDVSWKSSGEAVAPWPASPEKGLEYTIAGHRVWSRGDCQEDYDLIYSPTKDGARSGNSDNSSNNAEHNFETDHRATPDDPITVEHIVRLYASVPQDLLIATDDVKSGYVLNETIGTTRVDNTGIISGIEGIEGDATASSAQTRYFDLQGREVSPSKLSPGIYIRIKDGNTEKIVIQ